MAAEYAGTTGAFAAARQFASAGTRAQAGMPEGVGIHESREFSEAACGSILLLSAGPAFGYFTTLSTYPRSCASGSGGCRLTKDRFGAPCGFFCSLRRVWV